MEAERARPQRPSAPPSQTRTHPPRPAPPMLTTEITDFSTLQKCNDEACRLVEQGLSADEHGTQQDAVAYYNSALTKINIVLNANSEQFRCTEDQKNSAKLMQQKLNKTKMQVEYRLLALKDSQSMTPSAPESMDEAYLPTYEDSVTGRNSMSNAEYAALGDSIMSETSTSDCELTANATEIFSIADGVQTFFITPEGYVSAPSYPTALKIFRFNEQSPAASSTVQPPAFLQVGEWIYPLQPGTSAALQSNYGAYIFPDTMSPAPGASVGLMLPPEVSADIRQTLEDILQSFTMMRQEDDVAAETIETIETEQPREPEGTEGQGTESTSTKISKGLLTAAEYVSWGVGKGAEKAGELIRFGSEKLRTRIKPDSNPRPVDPKIQKGVQYVRVGSNVAVKVSSYIVSKLGQATMALAREAAPHIRQQGEKLLPQSVKRKMSSDSGKSKMDGIVEVAASGLQGFGTVYCSLEAAAKALGRNLANETSTIVGHKYGPEAGQLAEHGLYSAGNIAMTAYNANHLGVKAIAKRAAKDTGKAVLMDVAEKKNKPSGNNYGQQPPPQS